MASVPQRRHSQSADVEHAGGPAAAADELLDDAGARAESVTVGDDDSADPEASVAKGHGRGHGHAPLAWSLTGPAAPSFQVFAALTAIFIGNLFMGELAGSKFFQVGPIPLAVGSLQWPIVFVSTDLLNEYFGPPGVRLVTYIAAAMLVYCFGLLTIFVSIPASPISPLTDSVYSTVFGQSMWVIVGSLVAFLCSQFIDAALFAAFKSRTGHRLLWLRATGSTVISQLFDSFIIGAIGFWLPGKFAFREFVVTASAGYATKLVLAVLMTPLVYGAHWAIDWYLEREAGGGGGAGLSL
eukprot:tig00020801_g13974.t1